MKTLAVCAAYAGAVTTANVLVSIYGPGVSVLNSFLLIGLVLVLRDVAHDAWHGDSIRMFGLIAAAGILSSVIAPASTRIAIASCLAFVASESVDYLVYSRRNGSKLQRSALSNTAGAAVDSILFPLLAFGAFLPWIIFGQFAAKTIGGGMFSWLFYGRKPWAVAALLLLAAPARAQENPWLADIGLGGVFLDNGYSAPVVELFVATPQKEGFRLYGIASTEMHTARVDTAIAAVTRGWFLNGKVLALNAGCTWFRFEDYGEAHPFLGATASFPAFGKTRFVATGSVDQDANGTLVLKFTAPIL